MTNDIIQALSNDVIIDFEASSLWESSWPIEVAVTFLDGRSLSTWSSLIKPHPTWREGGGSKVSQAIHGIERRFLDTAPPAAAVGRELMKRIGRAQDHPRGHPTYDQMWLNKLLDAARQATLPRIHHFHERTKQVFNGYGVALDMAYERFLREKVMHRAAGDTTRLGNVWLNALRKIECA